MMKFEVLRLIATLTVRADKPVGMFDTLEPMRSDPLAVARRAQGSQPVHDVPDSRFHYFRILSIFCQRTIAFDHCDQKARSLFWDQLAADRQAVDEVFAELDEDALLDASLGKRLRGRETIAGDAEFRRLFRYLTGQGFEPDRVMALLKKRSLRR